jgi:TorA maturation chaperone TorD
VELFRALAALIEPPRPEHEPVRDALQIADAPDAADHTDLFAFQLVPYAAAYLNEDGMLGGEVRDRIAGFRSALGYPPVREPDALGELLLLAAHLAERAATESEPARRVLLDRARIALLWEHLAPWVFAYAERAAVVGSPFYRAWAELLAAAVAVALGDDALGRLPVHLEQLPPLDDPTESGADEFVASLLAPARSGMLLTRADLRRAAAELGLGLRQGERRYILRALLGQDGAGTLGWLEREARGRATGHATSRAPAPIRAFWEERAVRTAALLRGVRAAAV